MPRVEPIPWDALKPEQRSAIQTGIDSGAYRIALPLQIMAYSDHDQAPADGDRHPNFSPSFTRWQTARASAHPQRPARGASPAWRLTARSRGRRKTWWPASDFSFTSARPERSGTVGG